MLRLVSKQNNRKVLKQLVSLEAVSANNATRAFTTTRFERNVSVNNNKLNKLNIFTSTTTLNLTNEILSSSATKRFYASKGKQITMPALSPSMTEGNIASWKKKEGDQIKAGDVICEIETDKATMDFIYEEGNGYLAKILSPDGSKGIPINEPIAIIVSKKEDIEAAKNAKFESAAPAAAAESKPAEKPVAESKPAAASKPKSNKTYPSHKVVGMPALSPSMETGGIASWSKKEGDQIKAGDVVAQVETDKATMDFLYEEGNGYLAKILVPEGTSGIAINQPVFVIVKNKDDVDKFADFSVDKEEAGAAESTPAAATESESSSSSSTSSTSTSTTTATRASGEKVFSTPAARATAASKGFEISEINGTGPNGRIIKADVLSFTPQQKQATEAAAAPVTAAKKPTTGATTAPSTGTFTDIPHSNIRRVTAARLTESKQNIPHYYLTMECRVDKILKMRSELNAINSVKLSVNDFIIKASAAALRDNPVVNSTWTDSYIRRYHNIDINVAVNTEQGLFTPIVRSADMKGLNAISTTVKTLAEKAHQNKLQPTDFESGTFTISNLGMFGIKSFSAVINPPQAAILAVGTTESRVVPSANGSYENATILSVTLSCDHRVIDGALGAEWLKSFKDYMENPIKLLL